MVTLPNKGIEFCRDGFESPFSVFFKMNGRYDVFFSKNFNEIKSLDLRGAY